MGIGAGFYKPNRAGSPLPRRTSSTPSVMSITVVGSAGSLLTQLMAKAMNRSLGNVLFSGFGDTGGAAAGTVTGSQKPIEANDAGVSMYYVGVGPTRVDPLPEVFGPRRSQRIRRVEELPRVLAHVHRELVAA